MKLSHLLEENDPAKRLRRYALEVQDRLTDLPIDLDVQLGSAVGSHRSDDKGKSIPIVYRDKHNLVRGFFTIGYNDFGEPKFFAAANTIGDLLYPAEGKEFNIDSLVKRLQKVWCAEFENDIEVALGKGARIMKINDEQLEDEIMCWVVMTPRGTANVSDFNISLTTSSTVRIDHVNNKQIDVVEEPSLKAALEKIGLRVKTAK